MADGTGGGGVFEEDFSIGVSNRSSLNKEKDQNVNEKVIVDLSEEGKRGNSENKDNSAFNEDMRSIDCSRMSDTVSDLPVFIPNVVEPGQDYVESGLDNQLGLNYGPFSFDKLCREVCYAGGSVVRPISPTILKAPTTLIQQCRKKRKGKKDIKKKRVADLGMRVSSKKSYFSCIASRKVHTKGFCRGKHKKESSDSINSGESLISTSNANSDIARCNRRIVDKSEVGKKIWQYVSEMGVVCNRADTVIEKLILEMESKDMEGLKGIKEAQIIFP